VKHGVLKANNKRCSKDFQAAVDGYCKFWVKTFPEHLVFFTPPQMARLFSNGLKRKGALGSKLPPVKRVALFYPPPKPSPGKVGVKQRKHQSASVFFCAPVQSTGFQKQTMD
jgi:hypothetical protein